MTTATIANRLAELSPRGKARLAGVFYLLTMIGGGVAQGLVSDRLVVPGDAGATAANILAHQSLYRLGFAVYLIEMACQFALIATFYELLKPVNKSVARVALIFGLVGCTIKTLSRLFFAAPLLVLNGAPYLGVFDAAQLNALAMLFLRVNYTAETMAMVFFGLEGLLQGYLVFTSTFLPRVLGIISVVGGLGWMTYLYEPLAAQIVPAILGVAVLGALTNVAWLLVKGVDEERWHARAALAAGSIWR